MGEIKSLIIRGNKITTVVYNYGNITRPNTLGNIADLVWTTNTILEKRGHLSEADLEKIEKMGIDSARLYEILAHIGRKMIANYAVHIINPELDHVFKFEE